MLKRPCTRVCPGHYLFQNSVNLRVERHQWHIPNLSMSREETTVKIDLALSDEDINACHPIIRELRPGIARDDFLARVRAQEAAGYHMALARDNDTIVAVAGFRISENLA